VRKKPQNVLFYVILYAICCVMYICFVHGTCWLQVTFNEDYPANAPPVYRIQYVAQFCFVTTLTSLCEIPTCVLCALWDCNPRLIVKVYHATVSCTITP